MSHVFARLNRIADENIVDNQSRAAAAIVLMIMLCAALLAAFIAVTTLMFMWLGAWGWAYFIGALALIVRALIRKVFTEDDR